MQLKTVLARIQENFPITTSKKTIKRIIKKLKMSWHRFRRGTAGSPPKDEYEKKKEQLKQLKQQDANGEIALYFMKVVFV